MAFVSSLEPKHTGLYFVPPCFQNISAFHQCFLNMYVCVRHRGTIESESKSPSPETIFKAEHPELKAENNVSSHTHRSKSILESCHQVTVHKM